ncbi:MAG: hypothetical protein ACOC9E_07045, partial [Chloroflexota bacterium]
DKEIVTMAVKAKEEVTMKRHDGGEAVRGAEAPAEREMERKRLVEAATAEELGAERDPGSQVDVPEDVMEQFNQWLDDYKEDVADQADRYVRRLQKEQRQAKREAAELAGEVSIPPSALCPAGYNAFDVISFSPIELFSGPILPAFDPDKILRGTSATNLTIAAFLAIVWINPLSSVPCGFAVSPQVQLSGNTLSVRFDVLNVTDAAPGLNITVNIPLALPPALTVVPAFFIAPNVNTPKIFELNVTADIVESPRPYSAFATHHVDIDNEISIFGNVPPQQQHDELNRYMVYPF